MGRCSFGPKDSRVASPQRRDAPRGTAKWHKIATRRHYRCHLDTTARGLGRRNCPKNKIERDRRGRWVLKVGGRKRKRGGPIKASGLTCATRRDCSGHTLCLASASRFARLTHNLSFSLIPSLFSLPPPMAASSGGLWVCAEYGKVCKSRGGLTKHSSAHKRRPLVGNFRDNSHRIYHPTLNGTSHALVV